MRHALALSLVLLAGCACGPDLKKPKPTGTPTDDLLTADPDAVSDAELAQAISAAEDHYWTYAQAEGVCWGPRRASPGMVHPDGYDKGGDSALFTGLALAAWAFKVQATGPDLTPDHLNALDRAMHTMRGFWYVTHAAGPGVIARCAFPRDQAARWSYPEKWQSRLDDERDYVGESAGMVPGPPGLPGPLDAPLPAAIYYTRGTKDQFTGLVLGLAAAWAYVPDARTAVRKATEDLAAHLVAHGWRIRNENGINDTNADDVDGLLKMAFLAVWRAVGTIPAELEAEYQAGFTNGLGDAGDWFNAFSNQTQYFAHHLRSIRALSIWLVDHDHRQAAADYYQANVWRHVQTHKNAWFEAVAAVLLGELRAADGARWSLRSLSLKPKRNWPSPYGGQDNEPPWWSHLLGCADRFVLPPHQRKPTDYTTWQKAPWDVGNAEPSADAQPYGDATGLDMLAPYWLLRAHGL